MRVLMKKYFSLIPASFIFSLVVILYGAISFLFGSLHGIIFFIALYSLSLLLMFVLAVYQFIRKNLENGGRLLLFMILSFLICCTTLLIFRHLWELPKFRVWQRQILGMKEYSLDLRPGEVLPKRYRLPERYKARSKTLFLVSRPGQSDPCVQIHDGASYLIAFDGSSYEISYIRPEGAFFTREGFAVGQTMRLSKKDISVFPGWETHGPTTQDGWDPIIGFDSKLHIGSEERSVTEFDDKSIFDAWILGFSRSIYTKYSEHTERISKPNQEMSEKGRVRSSQK